MIPIRDTIPSRSLPVATLGLIAINAVVFFFEVSLDQESLQNLVYWFGIVPKRFTDPNFAAAQGYPLDDYWPFLTSMFLHGGFLHVLGNMWVLWIFGDNVEDRMGSAKFVVFYLLCGLIAGITHLATNLESTVPTVGASGAIAGVMGAYFLMFPSSRVVTLIPILFYPLFVELPAVVFLGLWFLMQITSGWAALGDTEKVAGIAFWAHVGGFLSGMVLCFAFAESEQNRRPLAADEQGLEDAWGRPRRVERWRI